jgi:hypothetical protein
MDGDMKKQLSMALCVQRDFFCKRKTSTGLLGVRVVFPRDLPAAGFQMKLLDETGCSRRFDNSAGVEFVLQFAVDGKAEITVGIDEVITEETWRQLQTGMPVIARVTHLYDVKSLEKEK